MVALFFFGIRVSARKRIKAGVQLPRVRMINFVTLVELATILVVSLCVAALDDIVASVVFIDYLALVLSLMLEASFI